MNGNDSSARSPQRYHDRTPSPHHGRINGFPKLDMDDTQWIPSFQPTPSSTTTVFGFSPPSMPAPLASSPIAPNMMFPKSGVARPVLSPQLSSPTEPLYFAPTGESPGLLPSSPRNLPGELGSRSRRNSGAIVSISLSSRSRSRTPRGSTSVLPTRSGSGPQSKTATPKGDPASAVFPQAPSSLADAWAPGVEEMDDWQPAGGVLLDADQTTDSFSFDEDYSGRSWTAESEASRVAEVLRPGMLFGEGVLFEGDVIEPAIGRLQVGPNTSDVDLPLRRDGSQIGTARGSQPGKPRGKKIYEVVRQLGSGSYAVVYLVRERGGRKREFALKCLSKHDLEEEQLETQLFEATIHLSLPIHQNIVTLHETLQTKNWLFLMLELCPGEDLFYWLERSRDASPPPVTTKLPAAIGHDNDRAGMNIMSSSRFSSSSIPFSSSQLFSNFPASFTNSPSFGGSSYSASPASLLFAHHNGSLAAASHMSGSHSATPPTPSLLSAFSANTLLTPRRLRLIAAMFSQMCEAVAVCHDAGVSHRDIKPENFICCDSVELEAASHDSEDDDVLNHKPDFGPQAKRKVVVKLTDFGLSTTEHESGDVECGSKPYMSYECRNNLGPTYLPAPADVWSLGIVLINMLFHRNPWKDPAPGDPNFDQFLDDPVAFLQSKFTGIGKEVSTYLAKHVLSVDVEDRVTARELGQWIRSLPEMIAGRRAVHALKLARLENRAKQTAGDKGLFVKSPVGQSNPRASAFTSALTSTAPNTVSSAMSRLEIAEEPEHTTPSLSNLPSASMLTHGSYGLSSNSTLANPAPTPDLDREEIRSATTVDDHPTPTDMSTLVSPEPTESGDSPLDDDKADERSISTHKRRKRGVRKGKAAQAAAAAAASGVNQEERESFLSELVQASEQLARDLSTKRPFDPTRVEDFPPLGTSPAQAAAVRKSRWKDFLAMSKGNPQLEALALRVAERDSQTGGTWSAPAKLQQGLNNHVARHTHLRHTATASSGFSSQLSSIADTESVSSTSSMTGANDDDWRRTAREREREREKRSNARRGTEDSSRSRQAALAAAAIAGGLEPMGSFGKPSPLGRPVHRPHPARSPLVDNGGDRWAPPTTSVPIPINTTPRDQHRDQTPKGVRERPSPQPPAKNGLPSLTVTNSSPIVSSPTTSVPAPAPTAGIAAAGISPTDSPSKKKQMGGLAKMFGGLKAKGRE